MKTRFSFFRFTLGALLSLWGAITGFAMGNADVLQMVHANLGEDTIIMAVKTADTEEFDTSAAALIELKNQQVSEAVIQAMLERKRQGAAGSGAGASASHISFNNVPDDEVLPPPIDPTEGNEYYLRYCIKFEKNKRLATNYWRGELVPINTKVTLTRMHGDELTLHVTDGDKTITVVNVPKFTNRNTEQLARELLAEQPTAIEKYGDEMAREIQTGTLRLGMTKTQVLMTRGYPPAHETSSLESDLWKYWNSRFVVQSLAFQDGVLVEARGVH